MAERILETPVFAIEAFPVQTRDGERRYFRLRLPDWVNVAAFTADGRLVLIRQHRWGIDQGTLEAPGGVVEAGEDAGVAGLRELVEETGYGGGTLESLGWVHPNPAIQDNRCHLYLLRDAERIAEPHLDPGEDIEVVLATPDEVRDALASGGITHALAALTLTRALARLSLDRTGVVEPIGTQRA